MIWPAARRNLSGRPSSARPALLQRNAGQKWRPTPAPGQRRASAARAAHRCSSRAQWPWRRGASYQRPGFRAATLRARGLRNTDVPRRDGVHICPRRRESQWWAPGMTRPPRKNFHSFDGHQTEVHRARGNTTARCSGAAWRPTGVCNRADCRPCCRWCCTTGRRHGPPAAT